VAVTPRPAHDETIIFLHLPKTAGSTLGAIVKRQYPPEAVYLRYAGPGIGPFQEILALPEPQRARLRLLMGHLPFGIHETLPRPARYVTILREPVERVVSHYYFVRRRPDHHLHETVTSRRMTLRDFVESGIARELENGQTTWMGWSPELIARDDRSSPELLVRATRNLEDRFVVAGLTERFDETLLVMRERLGWTRSIWYRQENVTRNRPALAEIDEDTRALIVERNGLDIELYRYVRDRFEREISDLGPAFGRELRSFRIRNAGYARIPPAVFAVRRKVAAAVRGR